MFVGHRSAKYGCAHVSKVTINTVVTTTLPDFEFNAFFNPAPVVISCVISANAVTCTLKNVEGFVFGARAISTL